MGLTVGVIGLGRIGAQWELDKLRQKPSTHLGGWIRVPEVEKITICDVDLNRGFDVAKQFVTNPLSGEPLNLENLPPNVMYEREFDIVSVATPAKTHKDVVANLMVNPPKLIFVEKPIATNLEDAKWMVDACAEHKVKLCVNHTRRWHPIWQRVVETLKAGQARPTMAVGHFSGDMLNTGIHMADLLNWYGIGSVAEVFGHRDAEYLLFELDIFFPRERLTVRDNGFRADYYMAEASDHYEGITELKPVEEPKIYTPDLPSPMEVACHDLAHNVYDDTQPACTGEMGLAALQRALEWERKAT